MILCCDFFQVGMVVFVVVGVLGFGNWVCLVVQQVLIQDQFLEFDIFGNVLFIYVIDIYVQLKLIYFCELLVNIGVGDNWGVVLYVIGVQFCVFYGIVDGSFSYYVLSFGDFVLLVKGYGWVGGLDCVVIVIKVICVDCFDVILLDGGDIWYGFYICYKMVG